MMGLEQGALYENTFLAPSMDCVVNTHGKDLTAR